MNSWLTQIGLINKGSRWLMFWAHLGLSAGFAAVFGLLILGKTSLSFLQTHLLGNLPQQELSVGLKKQDISLFRMSAPGSATQISDLDLEAMANLKGVAAALPITYATQPAEVSVSFFGFGFDSEIVIQGIEPEWVAPDLPGISLDWQEGETVPIVLSSHLLAIYNNAYAKSRGLPEISPQALSTPVMKITYGKPVRQPGDRPPLEVHGKVVGISPKVALGLALPNQVLEALHQRLALPPPPVTEAVLRLEPGTDGDPVASQVTALGFDPAVPSPIARALARLKRAGSLFAILLGTCICLFGFAYLNQTFKMMFLLKREDYAICRAMGMRAASLRTMLLVEAVLSTAADVALGLGAGLAGAVLVLNHWLTPFLEQLVGQAPKLLIPWPQIAAAAALVPLACGCFLLPRVLFGIRSTPATQRVG